MLRRGIAVRVLLALLTAVLWTCEIFAQPDCGNVALEHIFKAQVDEETLEIAFDRLHGLSETGRKGADEVFRASGEVNSTAVVNDLLNKVTPEQAERIFSRAAKFRDDQALAAIAVVARLGPYEGVEVGESIALYLERNTLTTKAKEQFFKDLAEIPNVLGSSDRLLKRAAGQSNLGETYAVAVAAEIQRKGDKGNLVDPDFDHGGKPPFDGVKIDIKTSQFGVQLKSRIDNGPIDETYVDEVKDLDKLLADCQTEGVTPAFASNGAMNDTLKQLLERKGIKIWENYVPINLEDYQ